MEPTASAKTHRIEIRVTEEERGLEQAAAAATGQSLSEFVRQAARREAEQVITGATTVFLNESEARRFLAALDEPDSSEKGLRGLIERSDVQGDLTA